MELDDILAIKSLCDQNINKLQNNLLSYQREVEQVRKFLTERWEKVERVDGRLITLHDRLLTSLSDVNAYAVKLSLQIKLNRPGMLKDDEKHQVLSTREEAAKHSQRSAIEDAASIEKPYEQTLDCAVDLSKKHDLDERDLTSSPQNHSDSLVVSMHSSWVIGPPENLQPKMPPIKADPRPASSAKLPKIPIKPRERSLLPPSGGRQRTSNEIYEEIRKNMTDFPQKKVVTATVMNRNIADNCFFVAKWGPDSKPIQQLLEGKVPLEEVEQLPDYGDIFAVYDCSSSCIPRVVINAASEDGTYEAYLIDYGEHIRLMGNETIFQLPEHIKQLPAEAVKCHLTNGDVNSLSKFVYQDIELKILDNNGIDLVVELLDKNLKQVDLQKSTNELRFQIDSTKDSTNDSNNNLTSKDDINDYSEHSSEESTKDYTKASSEHSSKDSIKGSSNRDCSQDSSKIFDKESRVESLPQDRHSSFKATEEEMAILNEIEEGTSDPLKALLGYHPTDEQRICKFYDPELNGCFKGNSCRLVHEPFAPHGATKDVQVAGALPETEFDAPVAQQVGSKVRMQVTYINSPTEVYAQFIDGNTPLVWDKNDIPETKCSLKDKPHTLDIVLALYCDGCYYRAQIVDELDAEYKIFYVDYGNTEFVPLHHLAPCPDSERLKPYRAISCHIEGVYRSMNHRMSSEGVEFMKSKLLNMEMDVKLVARLPDGFLVRFLNEYSDVTQLLIKRGYAHPAEGPTRRYVEQEILDNDY
ncbi:uncharacterized protein Dana_GF12657 [Drosophila ananassae]|uniref:C3H1-type domain-containing protein n=2 Tax=Drosophila ananassae TaxID=7217 RepID=B3MH59_DROAN|nr:uncharacterized protein Dana_GF12657 [Drosophila ananassae]